MNTDILIIGSGLGATAVAKAMVHAGQRVVLLRGVGCSRSPHLDGGVVDPVLVSRAFGFGAPLGRPVSRSQDLMMRSRDRFETGPIKRLENQVLYRRSALEDWAMSRAVSAGATFLHDFVEGKALPNGDGTMSVTSERDDRTIRARLVLLCEGADPRIPMRIRLRPDYGPEDQLHFARTVIRGPRHESIGRGTWRTSWGMPVELRIFPQQDGAIVSVVSRIENVMRSSRSTADALDDLLGSPAFARLGIEGDRDGSGMELVALRRDHRHLSFGHDRLVMGVDASGVIDPRRLDRADLTIRSGLHLAEYLISGAGLPDGWPEAARMFVTDAIPAPGAYHEDPATGYIEEGTAHARSSIFAKVGDLIRRGR